MKASAVLLVVFLAGAGTGYVGGQKYAEYKFHKDEQIRSARDGHFSHARGEGGLTRKAHPPRLKYAEESERSTRSLRVKSSRHRSRGEKRFMRRLERDLNLNPTQRANVDRALERHYERIRDIRSQMRPQINSIMQEIRNDVRSFLDNEQKISFDKMAKKFEERRKRRRWRKFREQHPGDPAGQSKKQ